MKNKIQYVRVLDYDKGDWYEELAISKAIIEVTESQISKIDYACVQDYMHRLIRKVHCEPVQMKELDKDIDGNYLECGDEVEILDKTQEGLPIGKRVFLYKKNGRYYTDQVQDQGEYFTCCAYEKVRKIPKEEKNKKEPCYCYTCEIREACHVCPLIKEEKKVDLIAEVEILNNYIIKYEREYIELGVPNVTNDFAKDTVLAFKAIKQHMEDKEK